MQTARTWHVEAAVMWSRLPAEHRKDAAPSTQPGCAVAVCSGAVLCPRGGRWQLAVPSKSKINCTWRMAGVVVHV